WGSMQLDAMLREVFGVFLAFVHEVLHTAVSLYGWNKFIFHHASLQCALVAIDDRCPRVLGVCRCSPRTVLPYAIEVFVFKDGCLGIGDIRLAVFLHVDPSRGAYPLRPRQV